MQGLLLLSRLYFSVLYWNITCLPIIFQTWEIVSFPPCTIAASIPKYDVKKDNGSCQAWISNQESSLVARGLTKMIVIIVKSKMTWVWFPVASACCLACSDCSAAIFVCIFEECASSIFASFCWRSRRLRSYWIIEHTVRSFWLLGEAFREVRTELCVRFASSIIVSICRE